MFKPRNVIALAVVAIAFLVFYVWFSVANPAYRLSDHAAEAFVRSSPEVVQWVGPIKSISKPWVNGGRSLADWTDGGPKCLRTVVVFVVEGQAKTSRIRVGMVSQNDGAWQLKTLAPQTFEESTHERPEDDYGFGCE